MSVSGGDITHILISGRVQGVGYRYFAAAQAKVHGIVSYVRNLPGGSVEVVAVGPRVALAYFIGDLEPGPSSGRVRSCQVAAIPLTEQFSEFSIRY